jgi:hypothetical protein
MLLLVLSPAPQQLAAQTGRPWQAVSPHEAAINARTNIKLASLFRTSSRRVSIRRRSFPHRFVEANEAQRRSPQRCGAPVLIGPDTRKSS